MIENPTVGAGVTTDDFQAPNRRARAVIIDVFHPSVFRSAPGVTLDFENHPSGRTNIMGPSSFRRFLPWDRLSELEPDPSGPYAEPVRFACRNPHCHHGRNPRRATTTLGRCPNCGSAITTD